MDMKKIISLILISSLLGMTAYFVLEAEIIKAQSSDTVIVTQAVSAEITISAPADITMSSAIPGITGNLGNPTTGSVSWTITTNNVQGYNLKLKAAAAPALSLDATWNFSDYSPATTVAPDFTWASPAASVAEFGFTVEPATIADTDPFFKDDGVACNTGTANAVDKCWWNFATTDKQIVNRSTETTSSGEAVAVKVRAESNAKYLKEGNYTATITATATMNP